MMPNEFSKILQYQANIMTDIKSILNQEILGSGIEKNIFEAVNHMKGSLL